MDERKELINFSDEVKRKLLNISNGYRTMSEEKKKLLQRAIEKLIDISTYSDELKSELKLFIKILTNS
ncbi:hypothetical protein H3N56_02965 [Cetobacterium sp. 2A]|uniref:hypothetical protein n=1 Tax=Cetobacterium sp. 2A TaxID=2754723 RepID=UPI00163C6459|nr:hypothetical protein [Cetobacterium sp. 2A]MBC2855455.1 hypothetical protein [Cetobacterium sp. 2A]